MNCPKEKYAVRNHAPSPTDNHWKPENIVRINGRKAIRNRITKELALAGKYGEIYEFGDGSFRALITSARVANRVCKAIGHNSSRKYRQGEEAILAFNLEVFGYMVKELSIHHSQAWQVREADNFTGKSFAHSKKETV